MLPYYAITLSRLLYVTLWTGDARLYMIRLYMIGDARLYMIKWHVTTNNWLFYKLKEQHE
jgi:hypothetical protein